MSQIICFIRFFWTRLPQNIYEKPVDSHLNNYMAILEQYKMPILWVLFVAIIVVWRHDVIFQNNLLYCSLARSSEASQISHCSWKKFLSLKMLIVYAKRFEIGYLRIKVEYLRSQYDDYDDDELFLWYGWPTKGVKPYFQPGPLSEMLTIADLRHATSRIWTCAEPEFRFCWMKLCKW